MDRHVFLQRAGAMDDRDPREVVDGRRRGGRPLERVGLPGIVPGRLAVAEYDAVEEVPQEDGYAERDEESAVRGDQCQRRPLWLLWPLDDAALHALDLHLELLELVEV